MRIALFMMLVLALAGSGCARRKAARPAAQPAPARTQKLIVTPENVMVGQVAGVNPTARFVVLHYPIGQVPPVGQRLFLYRRGLKVAEVRVSHPQMEDNTVADIVSGEALVGDEAREN